MKSRLIIYPYIYRICILYFPLIIVYVSLYTIYDIFEYRIHYFSLDDNCFSHSESAMFSELEQIAQSEQPTTPVLGCRISDALNPQHVDQKFLPSRINWIVQSSGVDYLHLMLVAVSFLIRKYNIHARHVAYKICVTKNYLTFATIVLLQSLHYNRIKYTN